MKLYIAKGGPDACGQGCRVWVAAEGQIDPGAGKRLSELLNSLPHPRPPIVFHSPGGVGRTAMEIGKLLRAHNMAASVGRTVQVSKSVRQGTVYKVAPQGAVCASACVYALAGATQRNVAPGGRLGVHAWRIFGRELSQKETEQFNEILRYYLITMGIDAELIDTASKTPFRSVHWLSRPEMYRYGLLSSETFETPWRVLQLRNGSLTVKSLTRQVDGSSRTTRIEFSCYCGIASFSIQRDLIGRERENKGPLSMRLNWDGDASWDLASPGASSAENSSRRLALVLTSQMKHTAISSSRMTVGERFANIDQAGHSREFEVSTKGLGPALTAISNCGHVVPGICIGAPAVRWPHLHPEWHYGIDPIK